MLDAAIDSPPTATKLRCPALAKPALLWLCACAVAVIAIQLYLALSMGINWDEFYYYDSVRRLSAGTLTSSLQTFHAHLFGWLLNLPGDVTDHIRLGRICMLACEVGAATALFGLARRFASQAAAALVAIAYLSGGFVVTQGTAFRADPEATFLLMGALWLLACRPLRPLDIAIFGLLTGLAAMLTIKVAIYAPAFVGIALLRWYEAREKPRVAWRFLACVTGSLLVFGALYAWHSGYIVKQPVASGVRTVESAWRVVFSEGLFPQLGYLVFQLLLAPHVTVLIILTVACWRKLALSRAQRHAIVGLMLPLLVLSIYRNSYPYFFVFLLPPVLAAAAPAMEQVLLRRYGVARLAAFMAAMAILAALPEPPGILVGQKRTIAVAHQLFPKPITYFGFSGYLGDYHRAISFMPSGWGLEGYRSKDAPQFVQAMERKTVPLLIANHQVLLAALFNVKSPEQLLPQDAQALRDNYIHFWGLLWVAGRHIPPGSQPLSINVLVPGVYTLQGGNLVLDGIAHKPGDLLDLERGVHEIGGPRAVSSTLTWGDHLKVPAEQPPSTNPYEPFW